MNKNDAKTELNPALPQWVPDLYNADDLPAMTVIFPLAENYWILREVNFHAVNLYDGLESENFIGEDVIFEGTLAEAILSVEETGATYLFTKKTRQHSEAQVLPVFSGRSSTLAYYSIVGWDYQSFISHVKQYEKDPQNIAAVYNFLNYHPMFWRFKEDSDKELSSKRPTIITDAGWDTIWLGLSSKITKKGKFKSVVMLESGGATDNHWNLYHDYNLDVYEGTLDKAYIKLAKLIHQDYDEHGKLRDGRKGPNENFSAKDENGDKVPDSKAAPLP